MRRALKAAQPAVVGRIQLQHPVPHAPVDRVFDNLWCGARGHAADKVVPEALGAQGGGRVGVEPRQAAVFTPPRNRAKGARPDRSTVTTAIWIPILLVRQPAMPSKETG